ncbi:MAG: NAD-dependent deacylase [Clostridiales Family XIII bacterium]|jgi:NAD-dependent deacetylase|nr:NAD-dependent deacylase [Clostridiales Family XIII bacterium]
MMSKIEQLRKIIDDVNADPNSASGKIVFFGGAGVSTESGIPDFRSESGLYKAKQEYGRSPEEMISHSFFMRNPETFYKYYKNNMVYADAQPNAAHYKLAELEAQGKLSAIVTQNIDGLHQKAGSKNVYELHGSVLRNYCLQCGKKFDLEYVMNPDHCVDDISKGPAMRDAIRNAIYDEKSDSSANGQKINDHSACDVNPITPKNRDKSDFEEDTAHGSNHRLQSEHFQSGHVPICDNCGGMVRPDVVLYEEGLDGPTINAAVKAISEASVLIVGGTSLVVYPAASFVTYFRGSHIVLINKGETSFDRNADLVIHESIGEILGAL